MTAVAIPPRWAERKSLRPAGSVDNSARRPDCVRIAFVNNMPDPALEDTEMQFFELLDAAAGDIPVLSSSTRCPEFRAGNGDSSM